MNKLGLILMNTIRGFSAPAFGFLIAIFGIKNFGKDEWGMLINAMLWVFLISFSIGWGHREYLVRKYSEMPSKIAHNFYSNLFSRSMLLPLALFLFFFFPFETAYKCVALVVLMHLYNSMSSLIEYYQKFSAQFISEIIAFLIILISIFYINTFNLDVFLRLYCLAFSFKIIVLIISLQLWKQPLSFQLSFNEFKGGFWFFAIGFSGWMASKIDIYLIDFYLTNARLSEYQLLITSFLMLQAISGFVIVPFRKHMYRSTTDLIDKIQGNLNIIGIPIAILGSFIIWIILEQFVKLNLYYGYYIMGIFITIPSFFYSLNIMHLMKNHQEKKIIIINCIGFSVNFILIVALIESYNLMGVLVSVCITQWFILILFKLQHRTKRNYKISK